jgi:hypothetical protein
MKDQLKHLLEFGWFPTVYILVLPALLLILPLFLDRPMMQQAPWAFGACLVGGVGAVCVTHNSLCDCKKQIPWAPHIGCACIAVALLIAASIKP